MHFSTADCSTTFPKDNKTIPESLFRGRKEAEKTVEVSFGARKTRRNIFLLDLSAEKSVFLPSDTIFRGLFPMERVPFQSRRVLRVISITNLSTLRL